MKSLCVILGRAGSKGLPGKNVRLIAGQPMIAWTIDHALAAKRRGAIDDVIVSTDGEQIADIARDCGVDVVMRPDALAHDTATVDAATRHAVEQHDAEHVVILYANVPVRPDDLIDRAVATLRGTGCDSVQSVSPVGKTHPYWMKRVEGDRLLPYVENPVYRRQDLPPTYMLDGGIIAVTRRALFTVREGEPHAFLGTDRRAIVNPAGVVVDVDDEVDAQIAEAALAHHRPRKVAIGEREVGPGRPCYVIAELGVNHDGSLDRALELARVAKDVGADAVKLQLFDPRKLLSREAELAAYQDGAADDPFALLDALQLSVEDMRRVRDLARELGLGFVVTPFSIENDDDMRQLDVDAVKIASPDCVNAPLIRRMRELGRPMLISIGASDEAELHERAALYDGAVMMQCVSSYPVPAGASAFGAIDVAKRLGSGVAGYSDHTDIVAMGMMAAARGAAVIEKHLTCDRAAKGPDHAASLDPAGFAEYVRLIRLVDRELAVTDRRVQDCEQDVRRVSRQSVCAARDLTKGQTIERADLTVKRPGTGIPGARLEAVVGRKVTRDIEANHLLHDEHVGLD